MKIIAESPEHHFLTMLEKIKPDVSGWVGCHFRLSRKISHDDLVQDISQLKNKLQSLQKESQAYANDLANQGSDMSNAYVYVFADGDIVLLARAQDQKQNKDLLALYKETAQKIGPKQSVHSDLAKDIYNYQKLADLKFLRAQRIVAYHSMADEARVGSIALRRKRRDDQVVMIVEDDRFTATYASNILNKEYDVVHSKTGEAAIDDYIEHAPDIVFMDIHLPGLTGHETLQAIRKVDPKAYVVMLSVDAAKSNVVIATSQGAAGFLKKPFSKERIIGIVQQSPFIKQAKASISSTRV